MKRYEYGDAAGITNWPEFAVGSLVEEAEILTSSVRACIEKAWTSSVYDDLLQNSRMVYEGPSHNPDVFKDGRRLPFVLREEAQLERLPDGFRFTMAQRSFNEYIVVAATFSHEGMETGETYKGSPIIARIGEAAISSTGTLDFTEVKINKAGDVILRERLATQADGQYETRQLFSPEEVRTQSEFSAGLQESIFIR